LNKNDEAIEPKNQIIEHFRKFIDVNHRLETELLNRVSIVHFKKGDLVIDATKICNKSYFVKQGLLRTYFIRDGKEINEYFSSENEWANSPRSWRTGKVDIYNVDALENATTFCIHASDMVFLFDNFPEMDRYGRLSVITLLDHLIERIASFRFTTAKEKYIHFKNTYPAIYHRIPLGMVASYLGIAPETLSRLRAEK
jgi:CRP-like cAMP-binding protein